MEQNQADQTTGRTDSLIESLRSFDEVIKKHPNMFNEMIMMLEVKEKKSTGTQVDARCDDHYFKTTHQGEKPQPEMLQKVESMGGGNCDKDERSKQQITEEYKAQLLQKDQTIEQMEKSLNDKDVKLNELQRYLKQVKARNDNLIHEIESRDSQIKEEGERSKEQITEEYKAHLLKKDQTIEQMEKSLNDKDVKLNELQKYLKEVKARNDNLIHGIESKDSQIKEQAESLREKEVKLIDLQNHIQDITARLHQMKKELNILPFKDDEIKQLKSRIALLSEKRLKQDQSKCEDTLSTNRQSNLEEEYSSLIDGARMDACDSFRKNYKSNEFSANDHHQRLACLMFEASYERMNEAKGALVEFFKEVSKSMIQEAPGRSVEFTRNERWASRWYSGYSAYFPVSLLRQNLNYPRDVVDALMLGVKETARDCNLDCFVEDVKVIIKTKWDSWRSQDKSLKMNYRRSVLDDRKVDLYIKECIRIVWCMITQVPAMKIEYQSTHLKSFHTRKGYYSGMRSTGDPNEEIAYYLWPALIDGGGRLVRKAEVLCKTTFRT